MSALEQEIMEKIRQLEPDAKQRILQFLQAEEHKQDTPSNAEIWAQIDARREEIRVELADIANTRWTQDLLDELREEESY